MVCRPDGDQQRKYQHGYCSALCYPGRGLLHAGVVVPDDLDVFCRFVKQFHHHRVDCCDARTGAVFADKLGHLVHVVLALVDQFTFNDARLDDFLEQDVEQHLDFFCPLQLILARSSHPAPHGDHFIVQFKSTLLGRFQRREVGFGTGQFIAAQAADHRQYLGVQTFRLERQVIRECQTVHFVVQPVVVDQLHHHRA